MKRKILSLILALLLVLGLSVCASADEAVSGAKNGVAVLATFFKGDTDLVYDGNGSCFFIGVPGENPQYLLTNYHVVADYLQYGKGQASSFSMDGKTVTGKMILRVYYDWNDFEEAYYVDADQAQDIALLKLAKPTNKRSALPLSDAVSNSMVGDSVHAIGYPAYADIVDSTSSWGVDDSLVTNGSVSRLVTESGTGAQWIEIAATEWGSGNSGGPIVTNDGVVVGMVSHSQSADATIYKAVNIESVFPMLKNSNVEWKGNGETQSQQGDVSDPTPAPTSAPDPEPTSEPQPVSGSSFHFEPWMIAVAAAVILAIALLVVLLARKKKIDQNVTPAGGNVGGQTVTRKTETAAYVRSLAAQHGGMRVQLGAQPVMIGRQADCAIRFQSGTPGVSAVHCQVAWDANSKEFVLTDLKSSYGTFLETGQRLAPHTPTRLRAGDSFYVGDRANILRVETSEV